jgi:hypothetical protein
MPILLTRVINEQTIVGTASILLDKIDKSQGNSDSPPYAQRAKQKVYIPYWGAVDVTRKGYVDMVQTDEVLLAMEHDGVIGGLEADGVVTVAVFSSALVATPTITGAVNGAGNTTITGTTYFSLTPDITYVDFTNLSGVTQRVAQADFAGHIATQIVIADGKITIGAPGAGWTVQVQANSKLSNIQTI